ncbi:hypothetical protein [Streptomyces cellostaticus]|uniref:hypothetical protein n=1 Tax=Streptomyces cellostaticus TaxID=67285 RepID=UPI00099F16E9|nr:hypothetical protein [Streptomyces cellostaticus]
MRTRVSGRPGRTIVITHDLTLAPDADRILVVVGGRLVETGTHGELLARGGAYARLVSPPPEAIVQTAPGADDTMILRW